MRIVPIFFLKKTTGFALFLSAFLYYVIGYQVLRSQFLWLTILYAVLFLLSYLLIRTMGKNTWLLLLAGIFFRLIFLGAVPNLSPDFYRFIWDGELLWKGINPYLYLPEEIIQNPPFSATYAQQLYEGMGALSASHYSNYPPLSQLVFTLSAAFSDSVIGVVVIMRGILILADVGVFYFGKKLLQLLGLPVERLGWYFLNPLILIELTGNLHFEGVMLFFFFWSLYALFRNQFYLSALLFAAAVSVKLIPLLFLPLLWQRLGWKKMLVYGLSVAAGVLLLFLPFFSPLFVIHYTDTLGLWFSNFQFNASVYNLFSETGFRLEGYNRIQSYGKIMPWVVAGFVGILAFVRENKSPTQLLMAMLWALAFYYALATTVHPWYSAFLVGLGVFTRYKFPLVWSAVLIMSYHAYTTFPFRENGLLTAAAYALVYGMMFWEIFGREQIILYSSFIKKKR